MSSTTTRSEEYPPWDGLSSSCLLGLGVPLTTLRRCCCCCCTPLLAEEDDGDDAPLTTCLRLVMDARCCSIMVTSNLFPFTLLLSPPPLFMRCFDRPFFLRLIAFSPPSTSEARGAGLLPPPNPRRLEGIPLLLPLVFVLRPHLSRSFWG